MMSNSEEKTLCTKNRLMVSYRILIDSTEIPAANKYNLPDAIHENIFLARQVNA